MLDDDLRDLIPGYLAARRLEVATLRAHLAAGRFEPIVTIAHQVRGSGGTYGFAELSIMASDLEATAKREDQAATAHALDRLADWLSEQA